MARYARVYQNSELVQVRKHRAYEVQVLREAFHLHGSEPGDVAARMSKIGGDAIFGRVVLIKTHHDRDGAGGFEAARIDGVLVANMTLTFNLTSSLANSGRRA